MGKHLFVDKAVPETFLQRRRRIHVLVNCSASPGQPFKSTVKTLVPPISQSQASAYDVLDLRISGFVEDDIALFEFCISSNSEEFTIATLRPSTMDF